MKSAPVAGVAEPATAEQTVGTGIFRAGRRLPCPLAGETFEKGRCL